MQHDRAIGAVLLGAAMVSWAAPAAGEASHHQGANPGQVSLAGVDSLAERDLESRWDLRAYTSFLTASDKLDDSAERVPLANGGSVQNYGLNAFAEYRFTGRIAASVLTGAQALVIHGDGTMETVWSMSDSFLAGRYTLPLGWGSLSGVASVKIPGTYPESEATGAKEVDQENKLLLAVHETGVRGLSVLVGVGYRFRLMDIKDELTPTLVVPLRLTDAWTVTAAFTGGIAMGAGDTRKDTLTPGGTLSYRASPKLELSAAYYRTVYGHNVVSAHIATAGVALGL
jgi:hypothetical protein